MAQRPSSFTALSEAQRAQAAERLALIRPALEEGVSQVQLARLHHLSLSTVQRWMRQYREQGLAGLARAPRSDRGTPRGLAPDVMCWIEELARQASARSIAFIHRQVVARAQAQGVQPPSYARVYQLVQQHRATHSMQPSQARVAYQDDLDVLALTALGKTRHRPATIPPTPRTTRAPVALLASKLRPPHLHAPLVVRERLLTCLDAGLERKLTLLVAPAGFGKTTLLAQWVNHRQRPAAWLSLDREDNDPQRFLAYLFGALQQVHSAISQSVFTEMSVPSLPSLIPAMATLVHELSRLSAGILLILDNYQVIAHQTIHRALTWLLDHLPAHVHLVLASRSEPYSQLARLRAAQQLVELDAQALRFTRAELEELLVSVLHIELRSEEIDLLERQTEGWIAGLHLAGFAMHGQQDPTHFITNFSGSNRYILAYLLEEVFEPQPPNIQHFLCATAILERFNGSLCSAVTGQAEAGSILAYVERANLFCFAYAEYKGWYRYHPLWAGALRHHLERTQPGQLSSLHTRASQWFEAHDMLEEAITHALAAHAVQRAAGLIEQMAPTLIRQGKIALAQRWLAALPAEVVRMHPRLCLSTAWLVFITAQAQRFPFWVDVAEQALRTRQETLPPELLMGLQTEIVVLRAVYAMAANNLATAIAICQQALHDIPNHNAYARGLVLLILGLTSARSINIHAGMQAISEAKNHIQATGTHVLLLSYVTAIQAELYMVQGYPAQAAKLYQQILTLTAAQNVAVSFASGLAYIGLGYASWEWNDLSEARQYLLQAWEIGQHNQAGNLLATSSLLLVLVSQAQKDQAAIAHWLQQVEAVCREAGHRELLALVAASCARQSLVDGHVDDALLWLHEHCTVLEKATNLDDEFEQLTLVRVLLAQGRAQADASCFQRALTLLERLHVSAEAAGRVRTLLEVQALRALALQGAGDHAGALRALEQAVTLAEPGSYVRVFVGEGDPMARLLRQLLVHQRAQKVPGQITYLSNLLRACAHPCASASPLVSKECQPLLDPLSWREREVLRLMATGRKNKEIAEELVVVTGTVKAHMNAIYQKLGVSSRVQAIVRARALGLL